MKKLVPVLLALGVLLAGCTSQPQATGEQLGLSMVELDGAEIPFESGGISFREDGTGTLTLGGQSCEIEYDNSTVKINGMLAPLEKSAGGAVVTMENTGLVYYFGELPESAGGGAISTDAALLSGHFAGRMYLYTCTDEWEEYEGNSLSVDGTMFFKDNETAVLQLISKPYSQDVPAVDAELKYDGSKFSSIKAFVFGYESGEGGISIETGKALPSEYNNTEFIDPHECEWFIEPEPTPCTEEEQPVIELSGNCRNENGSFNYTLKLIKQPE